VNTSDGRRRRRQHSAQFKAMDDLLDEMRRCKSVKACIEVALIDAYGPDEQAVASLTCMEEIFCPAACLANVGHEACVRMD
jgi:hypothetical protein